MGGKSSLKAFGKLEDIASLLVVRNVIQEHASVHIVSKFGELEANIIR